MERVPLPLGAWDGLRYFIVALSEPSINHFNSSLTRIMSNKNAHVLVGSDFNCGNIEWSTSTTQVPEGVPNRRVQSQLLEITQ